MNYAVFFMSLHLSQWLVSQRQFSTLVDNKDIIIIICGTAVDQLYAL